MLLPLSKLLLNINILMHIFIYLLTEPMLPQRFILFGLISENNFSFLLYFCFIFLDFQIRPFLLDVLPSAEIYFFYLRLALRGVNRKAETPWP